MMYFLRSGFRRTAFLGSMKGILDNMETKRDSLDSFYSTESTGKEEIERRMERLFDEIQNSVEDQSLLDEIEEFFNKVNEIYQTSVSMQKQLKKLTEKRLTYHNTEPRKSMKRLSVLPSDPYKSVSPALAQSYKEHLRESLAELSSLSSLNRPVLESHSRENIPIPRSVVSNNIPAPPPLPPSMPLPPPLPSATLNTLRYKTLFWEKLNISVENTVFHRQDKVDIPACYLDFFRLDAAPVSIIKKPQISSKTQSLDIKRDLAISTVLKVLNKTPSTLLSDILSCAPDFINNSEKLSLLQILLPKDSEIQLIESLSSPQSTSEQMISLIASTPNFPTIIKLLNYRAVFQISYQDYEDCLNNWMNLCTSLISNSLIPSFLSILLTLGNALNSSNFSYSNAVAIKISFLSQLGCIKSGKSGKSVMEIVCEILCIGKRVYEIVSSDTLSLLSLISDSNFSILDSALTSFFSDFAQFQSEFISPNLTGLFQDFYRSSFSCIQSLQEKHKNCKQLLSRCHEYFACEMTTDEEGCFILFKYLLDFIKQAHEALDKLT